MDQNKELEKKLKDLEKITKLFLDLKKVKEFLEDISIRCHERTTTFSKDNSHETAFLEGQRSILLFIKAMLKSK